MSVKISELPETAMLKNDDVLPCVVDKETSKVSYGDLKNQIKKDLDIEGLFQSVSNGKESIASAITDKGIDTNSDASFEEMAASILSIDTDKKGVDYVALSTSIIDGNNDYAYATKEE